MASVAEGERKPCTKLVDNTFCMVGNYICTVIVAVALALLKFPQVILLKAHPPAMLKSQISSNLPFATTFVVIITIFREYENWCE